MKKTLLIASAILMAAGYLSAADNPPAPAAKASFISGISINPIGVVAYPDNAGKPQYGAGLDLGYSLNKNVSLHGVAIGYESPDDWAGSAVDEVQALAKFDLIGASKLTAYGIAGAGWQFDVDDLSVNVGAGARFNFNKKFSAFGEYIFQVWVDKEDASQIHFGVGYKF